MTLVAVAKLFPPEAVRAVLAAGVADVGENYAKDLERKAAEVPGVRWHFVGRLQRNKAGVLVEAGALVHSLDSLAGARALGRRAVTAGTTARALVQVEVDDREAAHGVRPADLAAFLDDCRAVDGLEVEGLMVMPAPADDPEATRPAFRRAAELAAGVRPAPAVDGHDGRLRGGRRGGRHPHPRRHRPLRPPPHPPPGPGPRGRRAVPGRWPVRLSRVTPTIRSGAPIPTSEIGQTDVPGGCAVTSVASIAIVLPAPPKADVLRCLDSCRHGER